jgi:3-phosphoshikimate 1-carboxyvinyltransferase
MVGAALSQSLSIENLNPGRDVRATVEALIALGVRIDRERASVRVHGGRLREPMGSIDCMNSGSTARMLLGVCAGADVRARFEGDASLSKRPMEPVAAQLRAFGARIETTNGRLPLEIGGTPEIETRRFILLSPSAQIKSALLLAGVFSGTNVRISGDRFSRDHTERMLRYLGADIAWDGTVVELLRGPASAHPIVVPGDFSAASFFIVAAALTAGSDLTIRGVNVNPTRTGLLDILEAMGAAIERTQERERSGEPIADVRVVPAPLRAVTIGQDMALRAIDELPLVAIAAAFASGDTKITGIRELRTKESDRVAAIERMLAAVGIGVEVASNGLVIHGGAPRSRNVVVDTHGDHRTAMATAALAAAAGPLAIDSDASIDVSFPAFFETLRSVQSA